VGKHLVAVLHLLAVAGDQRLGLDLGDLDLAVEGDLGRGADAALDRQGVEAAAGGGVVKIKNSNICFFLYIFVKRILYFF
jgi:hypothetical protein